MKYFCYLVTYFVAVGWSAMFPTMPHRTLAIFPTMPHRTPVIFPTMPHRTTAIFPPCLTDHQPFFPLCLRTPAIFPTMPYRTPAIFPTMPHRTPTIFPTMPHRTSAIFPTMYHRAPASSTALMSKYTERMTGCFLPLLCEHFAKHELQILFPSSHACVTLCLHRCKISIIIFTVGEPEVTKTNLPINVADS
jgi:hypothetical protein